MGLRRLFIVVTFLVAGIALLYQLLFAKTLSSVVSTKSGDVQGIILQSRDGRAFSAYYGIPFAKPPIGKRRFQSPEKIVKWSGIWDATYYRPLCQQFDFLISGFAFGSEDCLYLNVFVPEVRKAGKELPVMAHIHGGYFHGGGTVINGPDYFMDHDVIVVTITYRVGVLGFLNTGDGLVRGNMGLKDQNLALQWIQKNIGSFGGDPNRVTLFGESAGGASVHYHMLSPRSQNLFSRAIRESGSALNYWTLMKDPRQTATTFAKRVNCPVDSTQAMVSCLQALDAKTLVYGHADLMDYPTPQASKFVPSVETVVDDDTFLAAHPLELVKNGEFSKIPVMSGFAKNEGLLHSAVMTVNETKHNESMEDWFNWAPKAFHYSPEQKDVSQKILDFYFEKNAPADSDRKGWIDSITKVYGDRLFNFGIIQTAEYERKYLENAYIYVYDHQVGFSICTVLSYTQSETLPPLLNIIWKLSQAVVYNKLLGVDAPSPIPSSGHADEFALLWKTPASLLFSERKNLQFSKDLVQLWVDFANGSNPLKFGNLDIPSASSGNEPLKFVRLSGDNPEIIKNSFQDRVNFWKRLELQD